MKAWIALVGLLAALVSTLHAQKDLTIDLVMEGPDFVGVSPSQVRFSGDGKRIFFRWREPGEKKQALYSIGRDGQGLKRLSREEEQDAWPRFGIWDRQRKNFLSLREGDIYLYAPNGSRRALTKTRQAESNAGFTSDEKRVYFTRGSNLFTLSLEAGEVAQVTDFRQGRAPREKKLSEREKFLEAQQEELFEQFSGDRKKDRLEAEERRKERNKRAFYYGSKERLTNLVLSPDEKHVTFQWIADSSKATRTAVPDYVTRDGYTRDLNARPKVGDEQTARKLGIYEVETGKVEWVEESESTNFIVGPRWNRQGDRAAFFVVSSDYKERWIYSLNLQDGEVEIVDHLRDEAWVGGPAFTTFGWMPDGRDVFFVSEADGWAHLYLASPDGSDRRQLTSGAWEVASAGLSPDRDRWLLTTSEEHLGERHFYTMPLQGGPRTRLTQGEGRHDVSFSADGQHLAVLHSTSNHPAELSYHPARAGARPKRLTQSTLEGFRSRDWVRPQLIEFKARDGALVPARFYKPQRPAPGNPAVVFVHGAGYLQNVHKWWSSYFREYMFHHILMEHGYHVLDIDYRGSAGRGRDWRTGIYRHMGGKDLTDHVDGVRWLIDRHGVDPKRVGIYGGSYGGFITFMAMFTEPDVFAAGASLRPVTDWAHYNHPYTARILNLPQGDEEAYRRSSPIYFAEGLKGALLICHGMVDTNVHFQDTVRLVQRLIELRKENWELAVYPVEGHGFRNASSWADEYKRIFKLFEENLK